MNGKTKIEKAWIAASVLALVAYRLWNGGRSGDDPLSLLLQTIMFFLSFPLGPAAMLPVAIAYDGCGGCREVSWMLDWSVALFVGYLQWFWIVPSIRERGRLTLLKLSPRTQDQGEGHAGDEALRDEGPAAEAVWAVAAGVREALCPADADAQIAEITVAPPRRRRRRRRAKSGRLPPHFDEAGLTPLGKVLIEP